MRARLRVWWQTQAVMPGCCMTALSSDLPALSTGQNWRTCDGPTLAPARKCSIYSGGVDEPADTVHRQTCHSPQAVVL